jgi:hypothetical protein
MRLNSRIRGCPRLAFRYKMYKMGPNQLSFGLGHGGMLLGSIAMLSSSSLRSTIFIYHYSNSYTVCVAHRTVHPTVTIMVSSSNQVPLLTLSIVRISDHIPTLLPKYI